MAGWYPLFAPTSGGGAAIWQQLKIGSGGFVTGLDFAPDGTLIARTDTSGLHKWNGSSWDLLTSSTRLPAGQFGHDSNGDWINCNPSVVYGVYEAKIAPSNSSRIYMMWGSGNIFRTDNGGTSWVKTNFTAQGITTDPNEQGHPGRITASRMAINPNDPDTCLMGTPNGLYRTTNAGTLWSLISTASVPVPTIVAGGMIVCFDDVVANKCYASSYGNGMYVSTDNGATWGTLSGSPTTHIKLICRNGTLYHIDFSGVSGGVLRKWTGSWSSAFTVDGGANNSCCAVDVDPSTLTGTHRIVVLSDGGNSSVSTNGGTTFTGFSLPLRSASSPEPVWLQNTAENYMSCGDIRFNPQGTNELHFAEGIGHWVTNPANTATSITWTPKTQGIENMVGQGIISPPTGSPLVYEWDRPIFKSVDPHIYPANHGPNYDNPITLGSSADWASANPGTIVVLANRQANQEESSVSSDGGSTWTKFSSLGTPPPYYPSNSGGCIAAASSSNFVWLGVNTNAIYYTTNGGTSWNTGSITGPISSGFYCNNSFFNRQILCADRVTANTFYLYYNGSANSDGAGSNTDGNIAGIYKSSDGGATWTKVGPTGVGVSNHRFGNTGSANLDYGNNSNWSKLRSVPNIASTSTAGHMFYTGSDVGGSVGNPLYRSTDGGATWAMASGVLEAFDVGFGAPAPGSDYPAVYISGWVGGTAEINYGIWQSTSTAAQWNAGTQTWTKMTDYPYGCVDVVRCINGDSNTYNKVYVGFAGSSYAYYGP